jgi:prepilin-type N-terminal cleavage/methylation domain-containing protein
MGVKGGLGDLRRAKLRGIGILQRLLGGSSGFTLVEVSVAVAILSLGVGLIGNSVFQVLSIQRFWQDEKFATKEIRHAGSWFAGDALKATATSLTPGTAAVNQVTLTLESGTVTYSQSGDTLVRQAGSDQNVVARGVVSVGFSLSPDGEVLTFATEVEAAEGGTEVLTLQNYLRLMQ